MKIKFLVQLLILLALFSTFSIFAQTSTRTFSGVVVTQRFELVPRVKIEVQTSDENLSTTANAEGAFSLQVPNESLSVKFFGDNLQTITQIFAPSEKVENLQIKISYIVPPVNESVVIEADSLTPEVERRNESVYKNTLFGRDDQLIQSLNAGINAGQHEGGGKSLEIRRFGFNTDHGGVNGGLKILVDNVHKIRRRKDTDKVI